MVVDNPFLAPLGNWYTCPNGHIFSISECGGAMQVRKCNECGEAIGEGGDNVPQSTQRVSMEEDITALQDEATPRQEKLVLRDLC